MGVGCMATFRALFDVLCKSESILQLKVDLTTLQMWAADTWQAEKGADW